MGDRGNIVVKQSTGAVFFYGHWSGHDLPGVVQRALKRKKRWDDESYLARIIFDEMTKGHAGEETGFGISTCIQDNEHAILVVDVPAQTVGVAPETDPLAVKDSWPFSRFVELTDAELERKAILRRDCTPYEE